MPHIIWNEVQNRAADFASKWKGETYEKGESQSFWSDFLSVYGIDRRRQGALFEYSTKKYSGSRGFIDLFWPGKLVAEQKSAGRNLEDAEKQASEYVLAMSDDELPLGIVVSDFATFKLYNLLTKDKVEFSLAEFPRNVRAFAFLVDETTRLIAEEDPVNRQAAEGLAALHNELEANKYLGRDLELLLVRLVFCLFADDAQIFERGIFERYIEQQTSTDGSDLGPKLIQLFEVLNTPENDRQTNLDEALQAFPYINGKLFESQIKTPVFTSKMRLQLIFTARVDWIKVSPAIFGSMFQGVMNEEERRNLGAHYTSEKNILRVIKPLFLDALYREFDSVRTNRQKLLQFHHKLATLKFLDPACGCGNFLAITYRELRRLEHKVVQLLFEGQRFLDVRDLLKVNVEQLYGIEIEEFPSRIAQTALWLVDHQMNLEASEMFGQHYARLPLTSSANIANVNALTADWNKIVPASELSFILGNPPFVGKQYQTSTQKQELAAVFQNMPGAGALDFVAGWYGKSLELMQENPAIQTALVSTNSITQGEQVGILWKNLIDRGVVINFAHRTFRWTNEASGVAAVFCVIVGFGLSSWKDKLIFDYPDIRAEPIEYQAKMINPYLVDAPTIFLPGRRAPLCHQALPMRYGSKPVDGGFYMFTDDEKALFLALEPGAAKLFRQLIGSYEVINGVSRWCLWLEGVDPAELRRLPLVLERIERVKQYRAASKKAPTRRAAATPTIFTEMRQPETDYLAIPEVSSETRDYLPIAYVKQQVIASNLIYTISSPDLYHFGMLVSQMHMAWVRTVCGRMKSDYRYSSGGVYNNFPWPDPTEAQKTSIETLAQIILDTRSKYRNSTLADLYDPRTMPVDLVAAHQKLDTAIDRLYQKSGFDSDEDRVVWLFRLYKTLTDQSPSTD